MTPSAPEPRRALFLHLPKTGGTTLRHALLRAVPPALIADDRPDPDAAAANDRARLAYLEHGAPRPVGGGNAAVLQRWTDAGVDLAQARVFIAHLWYGMHTHLPAPSTYVTITRDPVTRLRSLYRHRVTHQGLTQTPTEWMRAGLEPQFDSFQTRALAGESPAHRRGPCTDTMLDVAMENLVDHFAAVGVTERFDESVVAIFSALGLPLVPVPRRNESTSTFDRGPFPDDFAQWVIEHDRHDVALHRFAATRLDVALSTFDADDAVRRLHRINRLHATSDRLRRWAYPVRRRAGLWRRSLTGRAGR